MNRTTFAMLGLLGFSACACDSVSGECAVEDPFANAPLSAVTTLAGNGHHGVVDGVGGRDGDAEFYGANDVAIRRDGTIFIVEATSSSIRMIDPCNVVSTFAGGDERGFVDGQGAQARFTFPQGIAIDDDGTLYVADSDNGAVRKIDGEGNVSTLAEGFDEPARLAVDGDGNVYVTDRGADLILKIDPRGDVTRFSGNGNPNWVDGPRDVAEFNNPEGIAVDANGVVYVADTGSSAIRRIDPDGNVTTIASEFDNNATVFVDGPDGFNVVRDVAVDADGNVVIADTSNYLIRLLGADGSVTVVAGTEKGDVDGAAIGEAQLHQPTGITVDAKGNVIIADDARVKLLRFE